MPRPAFSLVTSLFAIAIVGFVWVSFSSLAQTPPSSGDSQQNVQQMTEQEMLLQRELENTLRSRARLGARHPSVGVLDRRIAELRKQLAAVAQATPDAPEANPFQRRSSGSIRNTTDLELREMVQSLTERVKTLEKKVSELEKRR